jgi:hypothetical protein
MLLPRGRHRDDRRRQASCARESTGPLPRLSAEPHSRRPLEDTLRRLSLIMARVRRTQRHAGQGSVAALPASRPLRGLTAQALATRLETALVAADGIDGAHCIHELWMRGEFAANIEKAQERLWQQAAKSIPEWLPMRHIDWLATAYEVSGRFCALKRGRSNIYLVLLDYEDRRDGPFGVYVGMSHYTPAQRFEQHKAGIRAAGSVLKRGIEVLTGPVLHLQHISRGEAASIEVALAEALSDAGIIVTGGH